MKIIFKGTYKSLSDFISEDLSDFTVITGKNGSGKSQLIEQFKKLSEKRTPIAVALPNVNISPNFTRIHTEPLIVDNVNVGDPQRYNDHSLAYFNNLQNVGKKTKQIWDILISNEINSKTLLNLETSNDDIRAQFLKLIDSDADNIFIEANIKLVFDEIRNTNYTGEGHEAKLYRVFIDHLKLNIKNLEFAGYVSCYCQKKVSELTFSDYLNTPTIPEKYFDTTDLIHSKIETIFYSYLKKRAINAYQYYRKEKFSEENNSISSTEFNTKHLMPWKILNELFAKHKLTYEFKDISEKDFSPEGQIHFDLIKKTTIQKIPFQNLSSGEKVIIGLIIKLFTSEFYEQELEYPELIIIDEPDAHLHPEMSKILIDVLDETFVKRLGIKVIITTHSPSTVALAPDDSIFQLSNEPICSLKKISKDDALKILTSGLPNLSIDYKNHRQIFVESPTDLKYYQTIFDKLYAQENIIHRLYFISSGYGKGNCAQVIKLVADLREAGNTTSFGVVDWDKKDTTSPNIYVHGNKIRYSIENFIFDPIYVAILLLEKNYGLLKSAISFCESDNQYTLIQTANAQIAVDFVIEKLKAKYSQIATSSDIIECIYGSNITLKVPKWYLTIDGHELKDKLIEVFSPLSDIKNKGEYEIELSLINIIGKVFPLVPKITSDFLIKLSS